jgi:hypothetical protein
MHYAEAQSALGNGAGRCYQYSVLGDFLLEVSEEDSAHGAGETHFEEQASE